MSGQCGFDLRDEDVVAVLNGFPRHDVEQHLATCRGCAAEMAGIARAIKEYSSAISYVATRSVNRRALSLKRETRRVKAFRWAIACALAVLMLMVSVHKQPARKADERTLITDEAVLHSVNIALSRPVPKPLIPAIMLVNERYERITNNRRKERTRK